MIDPGNSPRPEALPPAEHSPFAASDPDPYLDNWSIQARKGLLELSILAALEEGERYGYDIVRELAERPTLGGAEGTVYPLLARLVGHGILNGSSRPMASGPTRKYYALTPAGRVALASMRARFFDLVHDVLGAGGGGRFTGLASSPRGRIRRVAP